MGVQPLDDIRAVRVVVDQIGDIDGALQSDLIGHLLPAHPHLLAAFLVAVTDRLGRHPATRRAQFGDLGEQTVLGLGRQIHQQALGQPCRRRVRIKTRRDQCGRPILAKVDAHLVARDHRLDSMGGQGRRLVLENLGLIDLEDDGAGRPLQTVGPRIESGRQDHHLSDAGGGGVSEERIEEVRPHCLVGEHVLEHRGGLGVSRLDPLRHGLVHEVLPHPGAGTIDQDAGIRIGDQRLGALGLASPGRGHHHRRRSDAGGDVPGVVVAAKFAHRAEP